MGKLTPLFFGRGGGGANGLEPPHRPAIRSPGVHVRGVLRGLMDWQPLSTEVFRCPVLRLGSGVSIAVDIWGVDGGFAMDLNILTMDLPWICLFDTYPCPALLPFLHGVKLVPRTFCTERATSVATSLEQAKQQPVSQPPPDTR